MSVFAVLSLISFLLYVQAGLLVLSKNRKSKVHLLFAFLSFLFALYAINYYLFFEAETLEQVYLYDRIASLGWVFFPLVTVWFVMQLTRSRHKIIRGILILFLLPVSLFSIYQSLFHLESVKFFYKVNNHWYYAPYDQTFAYSLFVVYLITSVLMVFYMLIGWYYTARSNREKVQSRILLVSISLFFAFTFLTNIIFPLFQAHVVPALAPINALLIIAGGVYALSLAPSRTITSDIIYDLIVYHIREFLFITDKEGKILTTNGYTYSHLKYNNYELTKYDPSVIFSDYPRIKEEIRNMEGKNISPHMFMELKARDGVVIPVLMYIISIRDANDRIQAFVLTCVDYRQKLKLKEEVAERVRTEKNLSQIRHELEFLVKKRTRELDEANLRLQQEVMERKNAEEQIKADLEEKIVLVQEVHHRVKNNIQMIISLVNMLCNHPKIDDPASEKLRVIADKVRYISRIHEDFYSSPNLSNIAFARYLKKAVGELYSNYGKSTDIVFKLNIADESLDISQAIPLGIIFNELMMNALTFAFSHNENPGKKNIVHVEFYLRDNRYSLVVSDNGSGFSMPYKKLKEEKTGLQLVHILAVEHLKGEVHYFGQHGTTFIVKFYDLKSHSSGLKPEDTTL